MSSKAAVAYEGKDGKITYTCLFSDVNPNVAGRRFKTNLSCATEDSRDEFIDKVSKGFPHRFGWSAGTERKPWHRKDFKSFISFIAKDSCCSHVCILRNSGKLEGCMIMCGIMSSMTARTGRSALTR